MMMLFEQGVRKSEIERVRSSERVFVVGIRVYRNCWVGVGRGGGFPFTLGTYYCWIYGLKLKLYGSG